MRTLARIIKWIDQGYDGVATSNYAMGTILSVIGLVALSVDNSVIRYLAVALLMATAVLFGWRMILSFGRMAAASDRRKGRNR